MAGGLSLQAGVSLAAIAATATSVRLHTNPPGSYSVAVSSALGIRSFVAGAGFFTLLGSLLTTPPFGGTTLTDGVVGWFSICNDTASSLLAVGPLPSVTTLNQSNWQLSISVQANLDSPTLVQT